jgi:RimJ/RimL family protein N-acetyltransferase
MNNTVTLRAVIDSDLPIFFEQQNDPVANEMAAFAARDRDAFMAHWEKVFANPSNTYMTILYNDEVAGNMLSFEMDGKREVGYWLGRDFWGKGIASAALKEFLRQERTRPLYGYAARHNIGSQRVLEKCGFEAVGEEEAFRVFVLK